MKDKIADLDMKTPFPDMVNGIVEKFFIDGVEVKKLGRITQQAQITPEDLKIVSRAFKKKNALMKVCQDLLDVWQENYGKLSTELSYSLMSALQPKIDAISDVLDPPSWMCDDEPS